MHSLIEFFRNSTNLIKRFFLAFFSVNLSTIFSNKANFERALMTLIWKEFLAILKDGKVRISILAPPIIQLFIFAFAATLDVQNVSMAIVNKDGGKQAFELMERFYGAPVFTTITRLDNELQIPDFMDEQKGMMVLSIDRSFSQDLLLGKKASVQLIFDGRKSNSTQILSGYASTIIDRFSKDFAYERGVKIENRELVPRTWFNPNTLYLWYNIPCFVAVLSMMTALIVTTQSVARERELGTFDQILVSPLSTGQILLGKIIPGIIVGILEGTLMLTIGTLILGVPFTGSLSLYFLSLLIFVTSISGFGLFISALCSTQQQAMLGTFVFMTPAMLLSGFATPIETMPVWLQPFTYCIPLRYMLVISKGIFLKAMPAGFVFEELWPMCVIGCVTMLIAVIFFRRRL